MPTYIRRRLTCAPRPSQTKAASGTALQRCTPLQQAPGPDLCAPHTRERRRPCSALPDEQLATTPVRIPGDDGQPDLSSGGHAELPSGGWRSYWLKRSMVEART
jgi:hypothetical protein